MRVRFLRPILVLVAVFAACTLASSEDFPKELQDLRGHTWMLRGFFCDSALEYDYQGNVIGHPQPGPWALAFVRVDNVLSAPDGFRIEGQRLGLRYDRGERRFQEEIPDKGFQVALLLRTDGRTLAGKEFSNILERIFVNRLDPAHDLPEYWQKFFRDTRTADALAPWVTVLQPPAPQTSPVSAASVGPLFRPGIGGVTAPRLTYKTDPKYEELARRAKYQGISLIGTIITRDGEPSKMQILIPAGMGLDEKAIEALQSWRFEPSRRDGTPVAVSVNLEVQFRLF